MNVSDKLMKLDKLPKLKPRTAAKGSKRRRVCKGNRNDAISEALEKCRSVSEVATLGIRFGLTEADMLERAKKSSGFGQFRMTVGNLCRGVASEVLLLASRNARKEA